MKKVYIVEDDVIILYALKYEIEKNENYFVIGSSFDEDIAYKEIIEMKPDILLTDINLRQGCGIELIKNIRKEKFYDFIKILIMTGLSLNLEQSKEIYSFKKTLIAPKPIFNIFHYLDLLEKM